MLATARDGDAQAGRRGTGSVTGWPAYVAGTVRALAAEGAVIAGLDLVVDSDVPLGAGLSSSTALECATALAVTDLAGAALSRVALARAAQRAEVQVAGVPCGPMDQVTALCASEGHALFLGCRSLRTDHLPLPLTAAELALLVIDTRTPRRLVDGAYAERRRACEAAATLLGVPALRDPDVHALEACADRLGVVIARRARHVVTENARVLAAVELLRSGAFREVGPVMTSSHASLRDDFEVTVPELDVAVEVALAGGALGARMKGGGFGGCVLALVPAGAAEAIEVSIWEAFARHGFAQPVTLRAAAAGGARRVV